MSSGVFDETHALRACTWNGRALLHHDARVRAQKLAELRHLLGRNDVVALQETHLNREALAIELAPFLREWLVFHTAHAELRTGGTALLVRTAAFARGCTFVSEVLEMGRVVAVRAQHHDAVMTIVAVHNLMRSLHA